MPETTPLDASASAECLDRRRSGILLHVTSLPGSGPCGDLGEQARYFINFMVDCGFSVWQTLPVNPTHVERSPYQTSSVHAGNPRLIALPPLLERGWLDALPADDQADPDLLKAQALRRAWSGFQSHAGDDDRAALQAFEQENAYWLDDYALFRALGDEQGCQWWSWPAPLRNRKRQAIEDARERLEGELGYIHFEQFVFFGQWQSLREYAASKGVRLFGDLPIFVAQDSAEVWARPEDFDLDANARPRHVAGVPPDYFSATGQRWGNPLYDWEQMQKDGFQFWIDRIRTQMRLFDMVRIDHFRGFEAYWRIPAEEESAINGRWIKAPGEALFERLREVFGRLPLVAEDLGIITPEVTALRKNFGLPGMKVLQFAFSGEAGNPYVPFRHERNSVVYTGTHDNDTTLGWFESLDDANRGFVYEMLGNSWEKMPWPLIRAALGSHAELAVVPMQDLLGLGSEHRMNVPGVADGNWGWRLDWSMVQDGIPQQLKRQNEIYQRIPSD